MNFPSYAHTGVETNFLFRAERAGGGGAKRRRRRRSVANLNFFFTREGPNESILLLGHVVDSDGKSGAKLQSIVWRSKSPLLVLAM